MRKQLRGVLSCALALSMALCAPGMALAEEAAAEALSQEADDVAALVADGDGEQLDQEGLTPTDTVDPVTDVTPDTGETPTDGENPEGNDDLTPDVAQVTDDGDDPTETPVDDISVEDQGAEVEPEAPVEEQATATDEGQELDPVEEEAPQLTGAATEDVVEDIPVDGWAEEKLSSGKTGRVYYKDGEKLTGYHVIDKKGYYFDEKTGFVLVSATKVVNGRLCLFGTDGARITGSGWKDVAGKRYWLSGSVVKTGWMKRDTNWYYLNEKTGALYRNQAFVVGGVTYVAKEDGSCPANAWVQLGKKWYLTDGSSAARSGWAQSGDVWYYLDPATKVMKASQTFTAGDKSYIATASGACPANSWVKLKDKWYLTDNSCALRGGWAEVDGTWYYLNPKTHQLRCGGAFVVGGKTYVAKASGACPANEWVKAGNYWYLTDASCAARTGWAEVDGTWYYLNPKKNAQGIYGKMMTGLLSLSGKNYFLLPSGAMAANQTVKLPDGREAYAASDGSLGAYVKNGVYYNADGSVASGWMKSDGYWYYLQNGVKATGWLKVGNKWYWFESNGRMVTGERSIGGKTYYFEDSGAWIDENAVRNAIVAAAYSQIGAAYTEANDYYEKNVAFNCSGFSYWCYLDAGYTIPRKQGYYSYYWNEENKEYSQMWWVEKRGNWTTDVSNLREGDLVFFSPINDKYHTGHVGVYVGSSMMIDAFPGYGVSKRSVWQSGFVGGGSPIF
ncbi:MAG: NlpC/P60 family protein [Coriobacteriales bacterium]|nr:NlpC/P60 family protein [Coriobacteriales bacterium]